MASSATVATAHREPLELRPTHPAGRAALAPSGLALLTGGSGRAARARGPASPPLRRGRRGPCRARAGCRARRAARARRRRCRRASAAFGAATAGQITTSPKQQRRVARLAAATGPARSVPPSGQRPARRGRPRAGTQHVGRPVLVHEPLVQLGDRRLVDEQHRQLGVAPDALRVEHLARRAAASGPASTGGRPARRRRTPRPRPPRAGAAASTPADTTGSLTDRSAAPPRSYASTMSCTMRWRTTSRLVRCTNARPSMPASIGSSPAQAAAAAGHVDLRDVAGDRPPSTRTRCG